MSNGIAPEKITKSQNYHNMTYEYCKELYGQQFTTQKCAFAGCNNQALTCAKYYPERQPRDASLCPQCWSFIYNWSRADVLPPGHMKLITCLRCKTITTPPYLINFNPDTWTQIEEWNNLVYCPKCGGDELESVDKLTNQNKLSDTESATRISLIKNGNDDVMLVTDNGTILSPGQIQELLKRAYRTSITNEALIITKNAHAKLVNPENRFSVPINPNFAKPGYVYLAHADGDNIYKIGLSKNPAKRVKQLKFELIHKFPTDNMALAELKLHMKYYELRPTFEKEFFNLGDSDIKIIKSITEYKNGRFAFKGES